MKIRNRTVSISLLLAVFIMLSMMTISRLYNESAKSMLDLQFTDHGESLVKTLINPIRPLLYPESQEHGDILFEDNVRDKIARDVAGIIKNTPVMNIKLYYRNNDTRYIFSRTRKVNIDNINIINDEEKYSSDENRCETTAKKAIKEASTQTYYLKYSPDELRMKFGPNNEYKTEKYVLSVYVPITHENSSAVADSIIGVVEVYYDITEIMQQHNSNFMLFNSSLIIVGLILLVVIVFMMIKYEKATRDKLAEREKYLEITQNSNREIQKKADELEILKNKAEKLSQEKTSFIARISHELRTPMNAVIGLTDLLLRTQLSKKQAGYINSIQSSCEYMVELTDDVISAARIEAGYLEIRNQEFILGDVIEDVLKVTGNRAYSQGLELICEYSTLFEKFVNSDPVRLRQILINLLGNAISYTPAGTVTLRVLSAKTAIGTEYVRFEVQDTGIGIDKQDHKRIFAAYCQLGKYRHIFGKAEGLGLAITKRLVEAMDGTIGVESDVSSGSTFWVNLPIEPHETMTQGSGLHEYVNADQTEYNVLVISSNHDVCDSISSTLEYWNIETSCIYSVSSALERLIQSSGSKYTHIIVDHVIDNEGSIQLARKIRKIPAYKSCPLVILVPISENLEVGAITGLKHTVCVNKPILPGLLVRTILHFDEQQTFAKYNRNHKSLMHSGTGSAGTDSRTVSTRPMHDVLIVEDNPVNSEIMKEMFNELCIRAQCVADGARALDELMGRNYHLVMMDGRLPDTDGHEIVRKIRRLKSNGIQPVIIMTSGDSSQQYHSLCKEAGVDDFLNKPVTLSKLASMITFWAPSLLREAGDEGNITDSKVMTLFSAPVVDLKVVDRLKRVQSSTPEFFQKLVDLFVEDSRTRIEEVKSMLDISNYEGIVRLAHSIHSGCIQVGAMRMAKYSEILGNMARNNRHDETDKALQRLVEEFNNAIVELDQEDHPVLRV